jgi:hypothetical protein
VQLGGSVTIDPTRESIFKRVIEERYRVQHDPELGDAERQALDRFLKTFANSTSFGIHAELNREEPRSRPLVVEVYSDQRFRSSVRAEEQPGRYFFMPFATLITAGSRLILAMLEHEVTKGGDWVFCDTDSMAIVTDHSPEPQPGALTVDEINEIVDKFARQCPYEFGGSILKIEEENYHPDSGEREPLYGFVISAKRYALGNLDRDGRFVVRRISEHGLGVYQDPEADAKPQDLDS